MSNKQKYIPDHMEDSDSTSDSDEENQKIKKVPPIDSVRGELSKFSKMPSPQVLKNFESENKDKRGKKRKSGIPKKIRKNLPKLGGKKNMGVFEVQNNPFKKDASDDSDDVSSPVVGNNTPGYLPMPDKKKFKSLDLFKDISEDESDTEDEKKVPKKPVLSDSDDDIDKESEKVFQNVDEKERKSAKSYKKSRKDKKKGEKKSVTMEIGDSSTSEEEKEGKKRSKRGYKKEKKAPVLHSSEDSSSDSDEEEESRRIEEEKRRRKKEEKKLKKKREKERKKREQRILQKEKERKEKEKREKKKRKKELREKMLRKQEKERKKRRKKSRYSSSNDDDDDSDDYDSDSDGEGEGETSDSDDSDSSEKKKRIRKFQDDSEEEYDEESNSNSDSDDDDRDVIEKIKKKRKKESYFNTEEMEENNNLLEELLENRKKVIVIQNEDKMVMASCAQCFNEVMCFNLECKKNHKDSGSEKKAPEKDHCMCEKCIGGALKAHIDKEDECAFKCFSCKTVINEDFLTYYNLFPMIVNDQAMIKMGMMTCNSCSTDVRLDQDADGEEHSFVCPNCNNDVCKVCTHKYDVSTNKCSNDACLSNLGEEDKLQMLDARPEKVIFEFNEGKKQIYRARLCPWCAEANFRIVKDDNCKHHECYYCHNCFCMVCLGTKKGGMKENEDQWGCGDAWNFCKLAPKQTAVPEPMLKDLKGIRKKKVEKDEKRVIEM